MTSIFIILWYPIMYILWVERDILSYLLATCCLAWNACFVGESNTHKHRPQKDTVCIAVIYQDHDGDREQIHAIVMLL